MIEICIAWILTYGIHSTVLLSMVWLILHFKWIKSDSLKELLWKFAIVGGVLSATLQVSLEVKPLSWGYGLKNAPQTVQLEPPHLDTAPLVSRGRIIRTSAPELLGRRSAPIMVSKPPEKKVTVAKTSQPTKWPEVTLWICGMAAILALTLLILAYQRIKHLLSSRKTILEGELPSLLLSLCKRTGYKRPVRLTWSPKAIAPMALGVIRPEICLPLKALTGLSPREQKSMLAHELAHHVRQDPAWLALFRIIESVLFFQPLNRLARNRWLEITEYQCDAWAVEKLGDSLSLAKCLTEVASWIIEPKMRLSQGTALGMARNKSKLSQRINRLLNEPYKNRKPFKILWPFLFMTAFLFAMTNLAPGVTAVKTETSSDKTLSSFHSPDPDPIITEEFQALDQELSALEREVRKLKATLKEHNLEQVAGDLLIQAESRLRSLRTQRKRLEKITRSSGTENHIEQIHETYTKR